MPYFDISKSLQKTASLGKKKRFFISLEIKDGIWWVSLAEFEVYF